MKYRIGEVSKLLNLSDQMIRYYEKCGVISPKRSGDGQYRYYTDMDVFLLFDAMRYKEWGVNIADIKDLVANDYFDRITAELGRFSDQLTEEIRYSKLLSLRIEDIRTRLLTSPHNIGKYWIEQVPARYLYYLGTSSGDNYEISVLDRKMTEQIYSAGLISFFDPYVVYSEEKGEWWYVLEEKYHDPLNITDSGRFIRVPEQLCLVSVIDMGEPGEFIEKKYQPFLRYARENGYGTDGRVNGILLGRGNTKDRFSRLMKIMIPVGTL